MISLNSIITRRSGEIRLLSSETTLVIAFLEGIINWLTVTLILYITGLIISKSSIRFIDVAGTQALARFPYLFAALSNFIFPTEKIMHYFEWTFFQKGDAVELGGMDVFLFGIQSVISFLLSVHLLSSFIFVFPKIILFYFIYQF